MSPRAAGVGVGTVSRVINNSAAVRPATARAVREAMAKLGYQAAHPDERPGPTLGKSRPTRSLARVTLLIFGQGGLQWILNNAPVYAAALHGIELGARDHGCDLTIRQANSQQTVGGILRDSNADGVIAFGTSSSHQESEALRRKPAVWVMSSPQHYDGDLVQPDHTRMGVIAAEHALDAGHTLGAYVGRSLGSPDWLVGHRGSGFEWAMRQRRGRRRHAAARGPQSSPPSRNTVSIRRCSMISSIIGWK